MGNAGRVLMIPKGDYNAATTYEMLDCVYYNGRSYVCKQTSTGNAPTNTTYWQVMTPDSSAEIQALTNYDANTGVKNLFNNTATSGTISGVTFTVNTGKSVSAVGTLTASYAVKILGTFHGEAGKQYLLNGGISSTKFLEVYNTSVGIDVKDTGNGVTFTPQSDTDFDVAAIVSGNGSTFNDTFYPMIRDASITDPTYQPYAKTNVELTQDASWLTSAKTYYDANTDPTVKQNHYNVAKYFYDFIKAGESHTVIVRYAGGYFDTMIISRDSGNGLYCVEFCHADGLGKILYFRYNGTSDTFTDLFAVT